MMSDLNKSAGEAQKNWHANDDKSASVFKDWCLLANSMVLSRMANNIDRAEAL
jgi:hypothetical protein